MDKRERLRLELVLDKADDWAKRYAAAVAARDAVGAPAEKAMRELLGKLVRVPAPGCDAAFTVLPLTPGDADHLTALAAYLAVPRLTESDAEAVSQLELDVPKAVLEARPITSSMRIGLPQARQVAEDAAEFLDEYVTWGLAEGLDAVLDRITPTTPRPVTVEEALGRRVGLAALLRKHGIAHLIDAAPVRQQVSTFTGAEHFPDLVAAMTPDVASLVVCTPEPLTLADFRSALAAAAH